MDSIILFTEISTYKNYLCFPIMLAPRQIIKLQCNTNCNVICNASMLFLLLIPVAGPESPIRGGVGVNMWSNISNDL